MDSRLRGHGIGRQMMLWAHERGRARGCVLAQLTSDKRRPDAHRFYRSLGYEQSHEGFKLAAVTTRAHASSLENAVNRVMERRGVDSRVSTGGRDGRPGRAPATVTP